MSTRGIQAKQGVNFERGPLVGYEKVVREERLRVRILGGNAVNLMDDLLKLWSECGVLLETPDD